MHRRILFGIAAWLLGAATATAGSLLAVSLLGQGITGSTGPLLSQVAVNRALARESAEPTATPTASDSGTVGTAGASHPAVPSDSAVPSSAAPSSAVPSSAAQPSDAPASATDSPTAGGTQPGGTVLTSRGGDVVASCQTGGAYLDSWSPAQGFVVGDVYRGPAQTAKVTFDPAAGSGASGVTMLVSCSAGIPSATTHTWGTGDD
ncbi:hypothetical protein EAS64_34840 [Trebonia kvetii]|uniref:Septum formation initiator n=1 Tax=Trebonia kvetii TaxID=2480626 RepID=A0A6P2BPI8_9ACTN|nr:hypothetical protein [Trebonia kvetii]TVZ00567.1 hypothetical protein EAS64_34840 [Trebonia kvetii]